MTSRSMSHHSSPSSPGYYKSSHYDHSPLNRKRSYNSSYLDKVSRISDKSPKLKGSPGDFRKSSQNDINLSETDWSRHISSSGKVYYYNRVTEESQWEFPSDVIRRNKRLSEKTSSRGKEMNTRTPSQSYHKPSSDYDHRSREKVRDRDSEKDYRYPRCKNDDGYRSRHSKYGRSNSSSSGSHKSYTPEHSRSSSSYRNGGSETKNLERSYSNSSSSSKNSRSKQLFRKDKSMVNGDDTVQDITPPGTPTNDDTMLSFPSVSAMPFNEKTLYTNPIMSNSPACIYIPSQLQTNSHNAMNLAHSNIANPLLHPLQQALLMSQQHVPQNNIATKDVLKGNDMPASSPSLAYLQDPRSIFVKHDKSLQHSQIVSSYGSLSNDPRLMNITQSGFQNIRSPKHDLPPPPPPKTEADKSEMDRYKSPSGKFYHIKKDSQGGVMEQQPRICRSSTDVEKSITCHSERLLRESQLIFQEMPDVQMYGQFFSANVNNEPLNSFGFIFDKQANISFNEAMNMINQGVFVSKSVLQLSHGQYDIKSIADEVYTKWFDALDNVLMSVEDFWKSKCNSTGVIGEDDVKKKNHRIVNSRKNKENDSSHIVTLNGTLNNESNNSAIDLNVNKESSDISKNESQTTEVKNS